MREARVDAPSPAQISNASQRATGSSFYTAMRILPLSQREAMFEIYSFCRRVDDIADSNAPRPERLRRAGRMAFQTSTRSMKARSRRKSHRPGPAGARVRSVARGFPHRHRRHGDGRA